MNWQKKSLISVFFVFFLDNFGYAVVFPLLSPLLLDPSYHFIDIDLSLSKKYVLLGLLLSSFPIGQFIGAPIIGDLTDSMGRKRLLYITISGSIIGLAFSSLSIFISSYLLLLVSRFLTGLFAGNTSICMAVIADLSEQETARAKNYGILAALGGVSWSVAMLVGGGLSKSETFKFLNPSVPFIFTALISIPSLFVLRYCFYETYPIIKKTKIKLLKELKNITYLFKDSEISFVFLGIFFWYLGWFFMLQWTPTYLLKQFQVSVTALAFFLMGMGICWTLGSSLLNYFLLKKLDSIPIVLIGVSFLILLVLLVAYTQSFLFFVVLNFLVAFVGSFTWANLSNVVSLSGSCDEQGKLMGINQSIVALTEVLAPVIGSILIILYISLVYYAASFCNILALVFIALAFRHFKKRSV